VIYFLKFEGPGFLLTTLRFFGGLIIVIIVDSASAMVWTRSSNCTSDYHSEKMLLFQEKSTRISACGFM
jgi:hypothetical protein